jgi:hypothetical protein
MAKKEKPTEVLELGSCEAILAGVATKVDGCFKITLEINPHDTALVGKLMNSYAENDRLLTVAFVKVLSV